MLNWASRFNICLFLDNHAYQIAPHTVECLLAVGSLAELHIRATTDAFSLLGEFARKNNDDWLFGHFGYDIGSPTAITPSRADRIGFPDLFFFVPEIVIELGMDRMRIGLPSTDGNLPDSDSSDRNQPDHRPPDPDPSDPITFSANTLFREILSTAVQTADPAVAARGELQSGFTRAEYIATVERLRAHILRGDCYEINFCQEFFADEVVLDPVATYLALSEASPTPFGAFYRLDDHYLFCASPERYLACHAGRLLSQPIKGTSPRDLQDPERDRLNRENLYHSEKDRSENVMVVDLVRNDLSRVCLPGTVRVDELYGIYSFPQVHQMISTISGELAPGIGFSDCIKETFPMGSMTGAPKKRVMELIAQYERSRRGLFSGAVGYVSPKEDRAAGLSSGKKDDSPGHFDDARNFDFNVVIRSILYNSTSRRLSYQVGSGITFNSDPEKEYEECMLKAAGIRKALGA